MCVILEEEPKGICPNSSFLSHFVVLGISGRGGISDGLERTGGFVVSPQNYSRTQTAAVIKNDSNIACHSVFLIFQNNLVLI